jgi:hypothetical protein
VKLKSDESLISKILSILHLVPFLTLFIWCIVNVENSSIIPKDTIVSYCQIIYHIAVYLGIIVVFSEILIFPKFHINIMEILTEIDEIMTKNLKIEINYKTCKMISFATASPNFLIIITIIPRAASTDFKLFDQTYYLGLASATLIFCVMESFYNAIALQIYYRFSKIEKFLLSDKPFRTEIINELFIKAFKLIESINSIFGFFIVAATGKI